MAGAYIQAQKVDTSGTSGGIVITFTAGSDVYVWARAGGTVTLALSDGLGNIYNPVARDGSNNWPLAPDVDTDTVGLYEALNVIGGATTITVSSGASSVTHRHIAVEASGLTTTTAMDKAAFTDSQATTTPTSGATASRTQADEFLLAFISSSGTSPVFTAGSGFTKALAETTKSAMEWQVVSVTGTDAGTWTMGTPDPGGAGNCTIAGIATLKAAAATGAVASTARPLLVTLGRQGGRTAKPWALQSFLPSPAPLVPQVPPTISPILARFEQNFGRQPMGRVVPKESSPRNSFTLSAEVGSYTLTGQSASLLATRLLNATAGSYVLTGKAAGLLAARLLNGTAGSYTITGRAALLAAARLLNAGAGAYTYTGRNGALLRGALVQATAGSYVINGADASLTQGAAGAFVFGAAPGSYSITGLNASLTLTTVTPTPTPSQSPASLGGGYGIQDRYWREREKLYDRTKRKAKKKSKRAVEIVEELAARELELSEAVAALHEELAAANLKSAEVYVDLLRMKLEMAEEDDDDDDLLLLH